MANERVGTHEAKTHLSECLNRVRYGGERIVIERHGKPVGPWSVWKTFPA